MLAFYQTLEKAMADSNLHCGNWTLPAPERIYTPDIEARASRHLKAAAALAADAEDPKILERVRDQQNMWQRAMDTMAEARKPRTS